MRWACILLPHLALDGVLRHCTDPEAPRVLVGGPAQHRVLHAVSPAARALGLRPGMPLATAQALAHDFVAEPCSPEDEARWHRLLAGWAYGYSSQVSLQFAHALLLEIEGSLGLFGPWPRFEARLRGELTALGFRHRIVAAPNPTAARVLASLHDGLAIEDDVSLHRVLDPLPIRHAGFAPAVAAAFARMGLRTLRQVWALPRDGLARRFPPEVLSHLDALLGRHEPVLQGYRPPDRFAQRIELDREAESSRALLFPLRRLTADLAAYLAGRDGGVQRFSLRLEHEHDARTTVPVGLLAPERDAALLFELARGRLEPVQLPASVRAIALDADELPPFVPTRRELFDPRARQATPWESLRERLRARLGEDAVHGIRLRADHRPECASLTPVDDPATRAAVPPATASGRRPGWLLARPIPLRGPPPRLVTLPERIESGWWDGGDVRRDYAIAQLANGQLAWVFCPTGGGGFMLHGWFA